MPHRLPCGIPGQVDGAGMPPETLVSLLTRLTGIGHTGDGLAEPAHEYSITTAQAVAA